MIEDDRKTKNRSYKGYLTAAVSGWRLWVFASCGYFGKCPKEMSLQTARVNEDYGVLGAMTVYACMMMDAHESFSEPPLAFAIP